MTGSAPLIMSLRPMLILNKSQIKPILPTCQDQSLCYTCYIVYLLYLTQYILFDRLVGSDVHVNYNCMPHV